MTLSPLQTFREAFDTWIDHRILHHQGAFTDARYISPRTERDLRQYARQLELFFREIPLGDIHSGHLREYQRGRAVCDKAAAAWKQPAGANLIRKEVETLIRVMKIAGAWNAELDANFEIVQLVEKDAESALSPDEQHRWLHTAAQHTKWRVVYWYSVVAFQTTAATNEMRALRIGDVDLYQGTIQIRSEGAKNKFRIRTIPLMTPQLVNALDELVKRAQRLGADGPHCYLFPRHRVRDLYDATRPMSVWGLRKMWDEVRSAAQLPDFTPYHTRHTAITRMAEAGIAIQVAMSFAGHMSAGMQQRYIAIGMAAKRSAAALAFAGVQWNGAATPIHAMKRPAAAAGPAALPAEYGEECAVGWR